MVELTRRGFIGGLIGAVVAPAIIKTPGLLMPIKPKLITNSVEIDYLWVEEAAEVPEAAFNGIAALPSNSLLTIEMITREAVRLFRNSNAFIRSLDAQFEREFAFMNGSQWTETPNARKALAERISFRDWNRRNCGGNSSLDRTPAIADENRSEVGVGAGV